MFWKKRATIDLSESRREPLRCSFCNKSEHEVLKLIAGPMVFICDECVGVCVDILEGEERRPSGRAGAERPDGLG